MSAILESIIAEHAKKFKVGKTRLAEFARIIQETSVKKDRKISETSSAIRDTILQQKETFTSKDIAETLGVAPAVVNNNLYSLQRAGVVSPTGEKRQYGRGKPAIVWQLNS